MKSFSLRLLFRLIPLLAFVALLEGVFCIFIRPPNGIYSFMVQRVAINMLMGSAIIVPRIMISSMVTRIISQCLAVIAALFLLATYIWPVPVVRLVLLNGGVLSFCFLSNLKSFSRSLKYSLIWLLMAIAIDALGLWTVYRFPLGHGQLKIVAVSMLHFIGIGIGILIGENLDTQNTAAL